MKEMRQEIYSGKTIHETIYLKKYRKFEKNAGGCKRCGVRISYIC
jgi:hypothetical protein